MIKKEDKIIEKKKNSNKKIITIVLSIITILLLLCLLRCQRLSYTVTLNVDNEEFYKFDNIQKGELLEEPKNPEKEGYTFVGWFLDDEEFDFNDPIYENIELVAKWDINEYNVFI